MNLPVYYHGKVVYLSFPIIGIADRRSTLSSVSSKLISVGVSTIIIPNGDLATDFELLTLADVYLLVLTDSKYTGRVIHELDIVNRLKKPNGTLTFPDLVFEEVRGFEKPKNGLSLRRGRRVTL